MTSTRLLCRASAPLLATLAALLPAHALAQDATPSRGITLPDRGFSTQDDAASVEVNPAGLGFTRTAELQYDLQLATPDLDGTVDAGHALFASIGGGGLGAGFGAQFLRQPGLGGDLDDYRKYSFALGAGDGRSFSLGVTYNLFGSDDSASLDALSTWDLGLQLRLAPFLGAGFFVRDLDAAFLTRGDGEERSLPRRLGGALALRLWDGRIVLEPQIEHVVGTRAVTLSPRVSIEGYDGVRLFGRARFGVPLDPSAPEASGLEQAVAGLEASFGGFGVQSSAILGADGLTGTAHTLWVAGGKKRGVLGTSSRFILIDLASPLDELPTGGLFTTPSPSFIELMFDLDAMSRDPDVDGVILNVAGPSMGWAQAWEFRQAIARLEAAGKETVAVLQNAGTKSVFIGSAADRVWMLPNIAYEPDGLSTTLESYQGALAKLGVNAEFLRVRDFKSAPESYVRASPSQNSLLQTNAFLDALFAGLVDGLAADRGLPADTIREAIDAVPLFPHQAVEQKLVDAVLYGDELDAKLKETFGAGVSVQRGYDVPKTSEDTWAASRPEVALLVISGAITQGASASSPIGGALAGSTTLIASIERLKADPNVKAVVVRVDSPGGSALASDQIWRALRQLAQAKPVVASMGDVAASGGYYVAAGAEEIFATPMTLTGSIGIFAGKFSIKELGEKLGVRATVLRRGEVAGGFNTFEPLTDAQRASLGRFILYLYELFIQQVAHTRPIGPEEVDRHARGRVWVGSDALERKLVDFSGGVVDATRHAEKLAGLPPRSARLEVYPRTGVGIDLNPALATVTTWATAAATGAIAQAASEATPRELVTLSRWAAGASRAALLPLLFAPGEALMLPYVPLVE
jgi:protease-4